MTGHNRGTGDTQLKLIERYKLDMKPLDQMTLHLLPSLSLPSLLPAYLAVIDVALIAFQLIAIVGMSLFLWPLVRGSTLSAGSKVAVVRGHIIRAAAGEHFSRAQLDGE